MPRINRYVDIDTIEREAKKDYIDRHSPFIKCETTAKKGEKFTVTVKLGDKYPHPDDYNHYIKWVQLFNRETMLAEANFGPGAVFGDGKSGNLEVTFHITLDKKAKLVAHAYCTKHGIWESDPIEVTVE